METATLLAFVAWVVKNAPSFVNDMRLLINGWAAETGADPSVLLRAIERDFHAQVDSEIDARVDATYAQDGGP